MPFCQGQTWLNNGDIVQRTNPQARLGFMECENLDPLFGYIGCIIGMPIDRMIINITARATAIYLNQLIPPEIKDLVRENKITPQYFIDSITTYCEIVGFGKYDFRDYRYQKDSEDYAVMRISEPFSVLEAAGAFAGALTAMVGGEHEVSYKEVAPGIYEFTTRWTKYPNVLKEKLRLEEYNHSDGDIELERCASCGNPKALSAFEWRTEKGVILNRQTGRRMVLLGPVMLDPIFQALEAELGETIPEVVVEAQRRFMKTGFESIDILQEEEELRTQLALRGLGNLRHFSLDKNGLRMRVDNSCLHLLLAGMMQGSYEMALDVESDMEWVYSDEGELEIWVHPRKISAAVNF
jgi:ribosomal protein L37E